MLAADHGAFAGFTAETSSLKTTAGDVLLPIGYASESPVPVNEYLATHPQ